MLIFQHFGRFFKLFVDFLNNFVDFSKNQHLLFCSYLFRMLSVLNAERTLLIQTKSSIWWYIMLKKSTTKLKNQHLCGWFWLNLIFSKITVWIWTQHTLINLCIYLYYIYIAILQKCWNTVDWYIQSTVFQHFGIIYIYEIYKIDHR